MPCTSVRRTPIDLSAIGKIDNTLLAAALEDLKLSPRLSGEVLYFTGGTYNTRTGQMVTTSATTQNTVEMGIKQAYGAQVMKSTAKRFGWTVAEANTENAQPRRKTYGV